MYIEDFRRFLNKGCQIKINWWIIILKRMNFYISQKADMAVAAFTISALRQEVIDFTIPYIDLGLTVILKKQIKEKGLLAFMDPFTNDVWFLLLCSTLYVGLLLTICSKLSPYGFYGQVIQANENVLSKLL